jgi:hypothetical protein
VLEKRAYLTLLRRFDGSHASVPAIASLVCFAAVLTVLILFRLITLFSIAGTWCVETDEFWYTSAGGNWPLAGSLILVLFLMFVWNVFIGIADWQRSRASRVLIVANAVAIAANLYVFTAIHDSATIAYDARAGLYANIASNRLHFPRARDERACVTARRFVGRWRVIDRQVGYRGFDIPAEWIELHSWGELYAQEASWSPPYTDLWRPPYRHIDAEDGRWRDGTVFDAPWDFDLQGDILTLTTPPEWFEVWERSRVTLQRQPLAERHVFPNPYAQWLDREL